MLASRTTGILIGRWVPDSDFSSGIHEGNSRSVGDVAARRTSSLAATRRRLVAFQLGSDVVGVVAAVDADALAPRAWKHGGRGRRAFPSGLEGR